MPDEKPKLRAEHDIVQAIFLVSQIVDFDSSPCTIQLEDFAPHLVFGVATNPGFTLGPFLPELNQKLSEIDWQLVTIAKSVSVDDQLVFIGFGLAPIERVSADILYHAAPNSALPLIMRLGLLPSNHERGTTRFPDTEGKIHATKLRYGPQNNGADWWQKELSQKNNEETYIVIRIDMPKLTGDYRVYQDVWSTSGVVIDRIDRIPPECLSLV